MPTFALIKHKVITNFGETIIKTPDAADDGDINEWIKKYKNSIDAAFAEKASNAEVKVISVVVVG
jgi:hypothetical protein